jgi:hypothetical protein
VTLVASDWRLSYLDAKDDKGDIEAKKERVVKLNIVKLEESKLFERQPVPKGQSGFEICI